MAPLYTELAKHKDLSTAVEEAVIDEIHKQKESLGNPVQQKALAQCGDTATMYLSKQLKQTMGLEITEVLALEEKLREIIKHD